MKHSRSSVLLVTLTLVLIAALLSRPASARTATGILAGVVVDAHGTPVPRASVTLQTSDGEHPHATYTDASGHFAFVRFSRGQYDLRADSRGAYSDWMKRVVIHSGKTTQVTLRLTK